MSPPIAVALVNDYDVVLEGVARMLDRYRDRTIVVELDANRGVKDEADIVLYDNFAQPESDKDEVSTLVANPRARRVVVYTWNFHPELIENARRQGVHGYLSKTLSARDLVAALEAVHAGEVVISDAPPRARTAAGLDWPGRAEGLTESDIALARQATAADAREAALITFAMQVLTEPAGVTDDDVAGLRADGWTDRALGDVVSLVALNQLTGSFNLVAGLEAGDDDGSHAST